jgi:hypothetical protein
LRFGAAQPAGQGALLGGVDRRHREVLQARRHLLAN